MKVWINIGVTSIFLLGILSSCGVEKEPPQPVEEVVIAPPHQEEQDTQVPIQGWARFQSQCPLGYNSSVQNIPLELFRCPLNLKEVELAEPLPVLILKADCRDLILDIRGENRTRVTPWEIMPDGSFDITVNAGSARLKSDGAGNQNCSIQMTAQLWGRVDCTDQDRAKIHVQVRWDLASPSDPQTPTLMQPSPIPSGIPSTFPSITPSSTPSVTPSSTPSVTPSVTPSILPGPHSSGAPVIAPSSIPSPIVGPSTLPRANPRTGIHLMHLGAEADFSPSSNSIVSPSPLPTNPAVPIPAPSSLVSPQVACQLPQGCYFHVLTWLNQCQ